MPSPENELLPSVLSSLAQVRPVVPDWDLALLPVPSRIDRLLQLARSTGGAGDAGSFEATFDHEWQRQTRKDLVGAYTAWLAACALQERRPHFDLSPGAMLPDAPRILFISPIYRLAEASIGIVRLAFFLRGLGIRAEWIDATPANREEIVRRCERERFDVIGQGTTHYTFTEDIALVHRLAEVSPESAFILGGHGAVLQKEERRRLLESTPISVVVRGFGERSVARLALLRWRRLPSSALSPAKDIPGLYLLDEAGNEVETGVDAYSEADFRALHTVFDGTQYPVELGTARLITSTHCPFPCVFCSSKNFPEQPATRLHSSDVLFLVRALRATRPDLARIEFNDDNFSISFRGDGAFRSGNEWLKQLCDAVQPGELEGISTYCYTRADTIDHATLARLRTTLGLDRVGIGLEHVNPGILRLMKKGTNSGRVVERIRQAIALGIHTNFFIILFSKWETGETLMELVERATRLCLEGAHVVYNFGLQPLGGADVSRDPGNEYLETSFVEGAFSGTYRGKIVPEDPFVGMWFRTMNARQSEWFALQDELTAGLWRSWLASDACRESLWFARVLRTNVNINLSDTLTNLVRIHSMLEFGRRYVEGADSFFEAGAARTLAGVQNYVHNGPAYPAEGPVTIQDKVAFMRGVLPEEIIRDPLAGLLAELEVTHAGARMPADAGCDLGPDVHRRWYVERRDDWARQADGDRKCASVEVLRRLGLLFRALDDIASGTPDAPVGPVDAGPRSAPFDYID